jgi:hypothetical protein
MQLCEGQGMVGGVEHSLGINHNDMKEPAGAGLGPAYQLCWIVRLVEGQRDLQIKKGYKH